MVHKHIQLNIGGRKLKHYHVWLLKHVIFRFFFHVGATCGIIAWINVHSCWQQYNEEAILLRHIDVFQDFIGVVSNWEACVVRDFVSTSHP